MQVNTESLRLINLYDTTPCALSVSGRFIHRIREITACNEDAFPAIFGLHHVKRRLVEVLATGSGVVIKGDFGVGKTHLCDAVFSVLRQYYLTHPVYTNAGCPVRENSIHLFNYIVKNGQSSLDNICPVCRHKYASLPAESVPIERVYITEGSGFARLQGNEDIEPQIILGMYHLIRFAEIGDPFDPRVLEGGKIAHASGGVLFVDELGLMNNEAQYALIQALQERRFTPSNSRMTFPIDLLFVSTTNNTNDLRIHKAVANRLVGIPIERVGFEDEVRIVKKEIAQNGFLSVIFPELFLEFIVSTIRTLNNIAVYLGPRSSIRAALIASTSTLVEGRATVSYCDVKEGLHTEIIGQGDEETFDEIYEMLSKDFPSIAEFISQRVPNIENAFAFVDNFKNAETAFSSINGRLMDEIMASLTEPDRRPETIKAYLDAYAVNVHMEPLC
ncbi:sigma 54-interacting transcriptional regulator [Candidatus Magnetominusculus dajiuhuensis]|uniref:sigma 54-interacting transcriptional regulator n=1 Tax=Candidatus Magnetominusculus dajiuhuensis TaxID=3137712 RepID=UPI003B43C526